MKEWIVEEANVGDLLKGEVFINGELIRCKDCKWWTKQEDSLKGICAWFGTYTTGAWFCANARREEENENT